MKLVLVVIASRMVASFVIYKDYSLSWSKSTPKTFLIKSIVYIVAFAIYMPIYYSIFHVYFLISELFIYLFVISFCMYSYNVYINRSTTTKTKNVVIYGAGKAGLKLESEFKDMEYRVRYFCDDDTIIQNRSIDGTAIVSSKVLKHKLSNQKYELLVIAIPSATPIQIRTIHDDMAEYFEKIQVLPPIKSIFRDKEFATQLKDISVEDLLSRHPQDLDRTAIAQFIKDKTMLITGAGGSIGGQIVRECVNFEAKAIVLVDNSEYNLYSIEQEIYETHGDKIATKIKPAMQSVTDKADMQKLFAIYKPDIVIHAAAYKHVPLCESNIAQAITNNIKGTKNMIDLSIEHGIEKFVLISTDKAVRPTNVMGATKRICELYLQNIDAKNTNISAVRFGNVLGSSGSIIPKFKSLISQGKNLTVTHKDITRYFMLIPEACMLVLQSGALGKDGEIFILDMGKEVKIYDLAVKMISLSGRNDIGIEISGLRPGEKLYEELLTDETLSTTRYPSITVARKTTYDITKLNQDIDSLLETKHDKQLLTKLKEIVPEFDHKTNLLPQ